MRDLADIIKINADPAAYRRSVGKQYLPDDAYAHLAADVLKARRAEAQRFHGERVAVRQAQKS